MAAAEQPQVQSAPFVANDEYFATRKDQLESRERNTGLRTYPHKFHVSTPVTNFLSKYQNLIEPGSVLLEDNEVTVAGRIVSLRKQGKNLVFFNLRDGEDTVQIWLSAKTYEADMNDFTQNLRVYDIVGVRGYPGRTKTKELSVAAKEVVLLAPCLRMVPDKLVDPELRFRKRHLDGIVNHREFARVMRTRSATIAFIRNFFVERGFLDVETSMLQEVVGGAAARPFLTTVNATKQTVGLRISPELQLKQLVVAGINKVFEIGRQFRNEGLDPTHNPTFTSIESYEAYADYKDLISMTEELLAGLALKVMGSLKFTVKSLDKSLGDQEGMVEVDFTPPFKQYPMIPTLEELLNVTFPRPLNSEECNNFLLNLCIERKIAITEPHTTSRLLDTLVGEFIEPLCINPAFITEHPQIMSPLAKYHRNRPEMTERFELFVCGKELCNAYTELNDPHKQRECFADQLKDREQGDDEAQMVDWNFVDALDHGLPPTGGWGMGIDRLVMLLTGHNSIKEVLAFPMMKPQQQQ